MLTQAIGPEIGFVLHPGCAGDLLSRLGWLVSPDLPSWQQQEWQHCLDLSGIFWILQQAQYQKFEVVIFVTQAQQTGINDYKYFDLYCVDSLYLCKFSCGLFIRKAIELI
jgi:hypothetical protein